ncbi:MAG: hypothetical protein JOZ78_00085 [Chroococcidiopsidaceae cyanobacterium CP_BM_ER_R8_30]|nr:hypothetical protein [Chroococcidiopsidaceae cyanobacterium CP_BM_ER_R8_30]
MKIKEVEDPALARALDDVKLGITYANLIRMAKLTLSLILQASTKDI